MDPRPRRALPTRFGERIPTGVKEDKEWFDAVARRDGDKLRETHLEARGIMRPELIVQENPHRVEPVQPGPAELGIDAPRVEGVGLKHLELVDGV
jgi:hypothetical protein